jgi:hypothetical protein
MFRVPVHRTFSTYPLDNILSLVSHRTVQAYRPNGESAFLPEPEKGRLADMQQGANVPIGQQQRLWCAILYAIHFAHPLSGLNAKGKRAGVQ